MKKLLLITAATVLLYGGCATTRTPNHEGATKVPVEARFSICPGDGGLVVRFMEGDREVAAFCSESSYIYVANRSEEGITINFILIDEPEDKEILDFVVGCDQLGFMAMRFNVLQDKLITIDGGTTRHADGHVA